MARPMITIPFLLQFIISVFLSVKGDLDVDDFGAKGDGKIDDSQPFLRAWSAACESHVPKTIFVPRKRYLLNGAVFQGPCNNTCIAFRLDGILVAPDYRNMGSSSDNWLMFSGVEGLSIVGGYLDGQGSSLWACKSNGGKCPDGATSLAIYSSKDVEIKGLTSMNSKLYHIVIHTCENVKLQGVRIQASEESPNTDGVHVQMSKGVCILRTGIKTGDDCISIGPGTQNLWIQGVACGPGHGISIGSLGKGLEEEGVQNVTVKTVVFTGTQNGLRIKSWARPSSGFVRGVVFQRAVMKGVQNPIIIDQNYCPHNEDCPSQASGVKISQVKFQNIKGTSATKVAMKFNCSSSSPCKGIALQDIELMYQDQLAESFCQNVNGTTLGLVMPPSCL
ncbi:hypothetical protein MRB53_004106 [Persea americana]|uniref:Uncharacterized protein n=1 Tax=Persea americana TaxID=3435 RepID=A0ACC2MZL6_PERAE|nr:hypothetical protein MRB53_004106 [Persea americana]